MIELTKLNNTSVVINADLIQCIEETPDTVLTLTNGVKYVVRENSNDIVEKVISFKQRITIPEELKKKA